jgi:hypothetical protein
MAITKPSITASGRFFSPSFFALALIMDISELFRRFELAISYYNIPVGMYNHGRGILEDLLNLTECTTNRLVLNQYTGWHVMERPYQCVRMVYVLVKGTGVSFDPSISTIRIPLDAKVYAGQTVNFRNREYARVEPMRDASVKLCLAHNLSTYQMDSLETVMILYCFFCFRSENNKRYYIPGQYLPQYPHHNALERCQSSELAR